MFAMFAMFAMFEIVCFVVLGSKLILLLGLMMLNYDVPKASDWLRVYQYMMANSAKKLDKLILDKS
jgi:hypothetical protein